MADTSFSAALRLALDERRMSQKELAERAGVTQAAVCRYLAGARIPRIETADRIARVLGTSVDALFPVKRSERLDAAACLVAGRVADLTADQRGMLLAALAGYYRELDA